MNSPQPSDPDQPHHNPLRDLAASAQRAAATVQIALTVAQSTPGLPPPQVQVTADRAQTISRTVLPDERLPLAPAGQPDGTPTRDEAMLGRHQQRLNEERMREALDLSRALRPAEQVEQRQRDARPER